MSTVLKNTEDDRRSVVYRLLEIDRLLVEMGADLADTVSGLKDTKNYYLRVKAYWHNMDKYLGAREFNIQHDIRASEPIKTSMVEALREFAPDQDSPLRDEEIDLALELAHSDLVEPDRWHANLKCLDKVLLNTTLPIQVEEHFRQTQRVFVFGCYAACIMMAGSCLECAMKEAGFVRLKNSPDLKKKIKSPDWQRFKKETGIPAGLYRRFYEEIREGRNEIVHEGWHAVNTTPARQRMAAASMLKYLPVALNFLFPSDQ